MGACRLCTAKARVRFSEGPPSVVVGNSLWNRHVNVTRVAKGGDCKSLVYDFVGSSPTVHTKFCSEKVASTVPTLMPHAGQQLSGVIK